MATAAMPAGSDDADRALIRRVAQGDRDAFADLYRAYEGRLFAFIRKKLNDPFEAADILHIVFMEVWRSAGRYEERSKVSTWLFGIAFHRAIDRLRQKVPDPVEIEEDSAIFASADPSAFDLLNANEEAGHVHACIESLKPLHRSVVELAFFEDLPYGEIAQIMGCPEGTVKTRMYHAKEALKHCLAGRLGGAG